MRKLAIAMALSSTLLATPAFARDGAWYVGGEFGAMIVEDIDIDIGTRSDAISLDHDYGYDGGLFVGYDLGGFRIEAEAAYKKADIEGFQTSVLLPGEGNAFPSGRDFAGGNVSVLSFMLNGMLDFGEDDGISGFVGGGVGMARVKANNVRVFANSAPFLNDSDSGLAWQLFAGVRQAISDNVDVTVKYRFLNVDDVQVNTFAGNPGTPLGARESEYRFRSHSLLGGLTFKFGDPGRPPTQTCDGVPTPYGQPCPPKRTCERGGTPDASGRCADIVVECECPRGPFIVFFDWDKHELTRQAETILNGVVTAYNQGSPVAVRLEGHADTSGQPGYNQVLSERRAQAVRDYLTARGIPEASISSEGFGETRPRVATADNVREPQNRRVEITFGSSLRP